MAFTLCVCVGGGVRERERGRREEQSQQTHHRCEPGLSYTIALTSCSASCVYAGQRFATRPQLMIWKMLPFTMHRLEHALSGDVGMCVYSDIPPFFCYIISVCVSFYAPARSHRYQRAVLFATELFYKSRLRLSQTVARRRQRRSIRLYFSHCQMSQTPTPRPPQP